MIVLDASVLIAYLNSLDARHTRAARLLAAHADENLGTGTITLAEVLIAPARRGTLDSTTFALADLEVAELPLPAGSAARLASLRATTTLKMPDCTVLLTAQTHRARLASFDDRLANAAVEVGIEVVPDA